MSQNIPLCPTCGKAKQPHPMFGTCKCESPEQVTSLVGVQPQLLRDVLRLLEGGSGDTPSLGVIIGRIKKALGE